MQKILFVDDDDDIRTIAHMSLTAVGGWEVTLAPSGRDALDALDLDTPDLIVLDVMMPGMDGIATLKQIRERSALANTAVIFMTAKVQKREVDRYLSLGAAGLIAKPFDPMTLPDDIKRIVMSLS